MNKRKLQVVCALMCSATILLSGCSKESSQTGIEHEELKKENANLAKENNKLEGKYEELEEQVEVLKQELNGLSSMLDNKEVNNTQDDENNGENGKETISIPIYTKAPNSNEVIIDKPNTMRADFTVKEKLESIASTLSELKFMAFKIEVESVENNKAVIKIKEENDKEYDASGLKLYFENKAKYEEYKTSLVETLLQRNYEGDWVESIEIVYDGPEEWENVYIQDLENTYNR